MFNFRMRHNILLGETGIVGIRQSRENCRVRALMNSEAIERRVAVNWVTHKASMHSKNL